MRSYPPLLQCLPPLCFRGKSMCDHNAIVHPSLFPYSVELQERSVYFVFCMVALDGPDVRLCFRLFVVAVQHVTLNTCRRRGIGSPGIRLTLVTFSLDFYALRGAALATDFGILTPRSLFATPAHNVVFLRRIGVCHSGEDRGAHQRTST